MTNTKKKFKINRDLFATSEVDEKQLNDSIDIAAINQKKRDILFIDMVNQEADKYGLKIDWKNTDVKRRIINFLGDDDQQIENFCRWLAENFDEVIFN